MYYLVASITKKVIAVLIIFIRSKRYIELFLKQVTSVNMQQITFNNVINTIGNIW